MEPLAAAETLAGRELLACRGDVEGACQPEHAEEERGEHGQGDEPAAWRMQGRGACRIWRMQGR